MWTGAKPIESPYLLIGQISTFGYFAYLLIIIPLFSELHLIYNKFRLFYPFNMNYRLNEIFGVSFAWFLNTLRGKEDVVTLNVVSEKDILGMAHDSRVKVIKQLEALSSANTLSNKVDAALLLDLENLDTENLKVDSLAAKTITPSGDLLEYKKWTGIVYYMQFLLNAKEQEAVINFLSNGLDLPLTDEDYALLEKENLDINIYKIAKHYRVFKETTRAVLFDEGVNFNSSDNKSSLFSDLSNIAFFVFQETQDRFLNISTRTFFDNFLENTTKRFKHDS